MVVFNNLADVLDQVSKDEAREVAYRLSRRYCRSGSRTRSWNSDKKKIPTKDSVGPEMEKPKA